MSFGIIVPFLVFGLLFSAVWTSIASNNRNNAVYAQQQQIPIPIPKQHNIKIISPTAGQQVPLSSNLTVRGIVNYGLATPSSRTPSTTSSCYVSVEVNGVPPYNRAMATGTGGPHDYSKWKYILDPKSSALKEGPNNKIAARLSCPQAPSLDSRDVVSLTGIAGSTPTTTNANQTQQKVPSATSFIPHARPEPRGIPGHH
jgi:hypothetical protein